MPWLVKFTYPDGKYGPIKRFAGSRNYFSDVTDKVHKQYKNFLRKGGRYELEYIEEDDAKASR